LKALERDSFELRRANEILKKGRLTEVDLERNAYYLLAVLQSRGRLLLRLC